MATDRTMTERPRVRWAAWVGWGLAWTWTLVAGVGGASLLIARGPWPLTNGWYALASGVAACPLTARLIGRLSGRTPSGWMRFAVAAGLYLAGHAALALAGRSAF
jgi:hypothetical protein